MSTLLWILIFILGGIGIALIFEESRDWLSDAFEYIITFEWISDVGEFFGDSWEAITNLGDSPLVNVWFWAFLITLLASVWFLPGQLGLKDYTLGQKFLYTAIFFVIDWVIISHFQNS